ncbi:carbohydrate ABC transporter substrate-binding protein (CUT1 family) [Paenibacillus taihuensis]|uniref:Carbohydrate ABC transporter substrate-binding protein (CUT1 family) n=1 Tax=Paenibacillus taihuensis TaxID=1156355 RepID=A0A3D9S1M9_9BACL|nr:extracellular solute-binding protein [Paenibacillus taihuensis]REE86211.1 carbohydrate ABC transporter substrate-binding protein (CUT1 family) [Paenibacillus taihuensis]
MSRKWLKVLTLPVMVSMLLSGCAGNNSTNDASKDEGSNSKNATTNNAAATNATASNSTDGKPASWIADRKLKGLIFMDSDDYTEDMNPDIKAEIKKETGIDFEIELMKADHSIDGLIAGLAAGDLPDFVAFYLNNSGRPEMPVVLKAAREGMFTDLAPLYKDTKVFSKYLQDGFLPADTQYGVMFRPEFNGSAYFTHMNIDRNGGQVTWRGVGGPYIRKDIADALGVDPRTITTTDQLYDLAKKIKAGNFKDDNGAPVTPIGPRYWGGQEVGALFDDLEWGATDQRIKADKDGNILHEAETDYAIKKVEYVQKLLKEKLLHPEFFTMDESRATEGAINGSWGIVADMHSYQDFEQSLRYEPIGPINKVDGSNQKVLDFKTGYSAWAIPSTTKNPEDIVKFADWLASRQGKLLWKYGIEGRDYTLDAKGNPVVKQEVLDLKAKDPNAAKALGFAGVGNNWGDILGSTDNDNLADFGEANYGDNANANQFPAVEKIAEYYGLDQKNKDALVVDAYQPTAFLGEFASGTDLKTAMDNYNDSLVQAYYAKDLDQAKKILDSALKQLKAAGLDDYLKMLKDKNADPKTKVKL